MKKVAMFSGGKDSSATIIIMRELGITPDLVVFSEVMFDNSRGISGELPEHLDFIYGTAKPLFESWGCRFEVVRSAKDYITLCNERIMRSKYPERIGKKRGFCIANRCAVKRDLKVRAAQKWLKSNVQEPYIQFLGIAADEQNRIASMEKNCRSILNEQGVTESEALQIAERNGLLSPIYDNGRRGGCWFCPNAPYCEFARLKKNFPDLWNELAELDKIEERVSPYFKFNETFTDVDEKADRIIESGLLDQMNIWEYLRKNSKRV